MIERDTNHYRRINKSYYFISFVLFLTFLEANSQCNPPDQLPTVQCINAPLTCLQGACYSTTSQTDAGWNEFCGNSTVIDNPQYFQIVPIADCIEIRILVDGCSSGSGLEAALVTSCQWQPCPGGLIPCIDVLDCDPGTTVDNTMVINACNLTPGVPLWLIIDGISGALCQYTIDNVQGIFKPLFEGELNAGGAFPQLVCQGFNDLLLQVEPHNSDTQGYIWDLEWTGSTVTSTLPEITVDIDENIPPGTYNICVRAFSGCDTTDIQ